MASHARPKPSRVPRTLLRAGLTVSAAGAALAAGGTATANAAVAPRNGSETVATVKAVTGAVSNTAAGATGPMKSLQLNPLAKTPADPLNNGVGTQVADFKPVSTKQVTDHLSNGGAIGDLPVVGRAARMLPG
ncbi:hypothetical protein FCH28_18300 [Streptomyces piniterrae]|uniref:ATP-binding protein n=1 Tax=Streptomyces piniterrae TaxID=2571125 RepID=A0A4V5MKG3_9ACTN|nr:hypothetical protein [Streptomyces piniterrae]TJZ53088.1 hypothetical protein FCH28_18300 [Streptomyces piniterrae]